MLKKNFLWLALVLMSLPAWADGISSLSVNHSFEHSFQGLQPAESRSLFAPSLHQKSMDISSLVFKEGVSIGYTFSPVFQLSFSNILFADFLYFGMDYGFNFGTKTYETMRDVENPFNPLSYSRFSMGFKLGPLMLGCGMGYTWNTEKAHWLYCFGPGPGLIASAVGKIADSSTYFFNGVYFTWGPEVHMQLGHVMLSGGYHMYPKLDMDHFFLGIGICIDGVPRFAC